MNWLGGGLRVLSAAILGCLAGAILFVILRRHGLDLVPVVGLLAGLATAMVSRERSGPRGVVVGALALWGGALAEVLAWPSRDVFHDILAFHERLGWLRLAAYSVSALIAIVLGRRSFARPRGPSNHRNRSDRQDVVR